MTNLGVRLMGRINDDYSIIDSAKGSPVTSIWRWNLNIFGKKSFRPTLMDFFNSNGLYSFTLKYANGQISSAFGLKWHSWWSHGMALNWSMQSTTPTYVHDEKNRHSRQMYFYSCIFRGGMSKQPPESRVDTISRFCGSCWIKYILSVVIIQIKRPPINFATPDDCCDWIETGGKCPLNVFWVLGFVLFVNNFC